MLPLGLAFLTACSSTRVDTSTAEGAFERGEQLKKSGRYEEAIQFFSEVRNKHPYSRLAPEAELKIADIQFSRKNYPEAESSYKLFKQLHPNHPKMDYVTFRLGLSLFNQLPRTIDRDLTLASSAILYFEEVINSFPNSEHAEEATQKRDEARNMLVEKDFYIADFYYKRKRWLSALGRYEDIIGINNLSSELDKKALYRAAVSAFRSQEMDRAQVHFRQLLDRHPESTELEQARKELSGER